MRKKILSEVKRTLKLKGNPFLCEYNKFAI